MFNEKQSVTGTSYILVHKIAAHGKPFTDGTSSRVYDESRK